MKPKLCRSLFDRCRITRYGRFRAQGLKRWVQCNLLPLRVAKMVVLKILKLKLQTIKRITVIHSKKTGMVSVCGGSWGLSK